MRACVDAAPVIDGRRANCNLASLGVQRSKPSTPKNGILLFFSFPFFWGGIIIHTIWIICILVLCLI